MSSKSNLMTEQGNFDVYEVEALGNQAAVIEGRVVYVANTGHHGINVGIALAALGAAIDLGYLAWPTLSYEFPENGNE